MRFKSAPSTDIPILKREGIEEMIRNSFRSPRTHRPKMAGDDFKTVQALLDARLSLKLNDILSPEEVWPGNQLESTQTDFNWKALEEELDLQMDTLKFCIREEVVQDHG